MVPVPVLAFCTFVQYQYGYGKLLVLGLNGASTGIGIYAVWSSMHCTLAVLALNGARTGIGIHAFWSSTSISTVHYQYWH